MKKNKISELEEFRRITGLTQADVARLTGLSQQTISIYERKSPDQGPTKRVLRSLAKLFGTTCDEIVNGPSENTVISLSKKRWGKYNSTFISSNNKFLDDPEEKILCTYFSTLNKDNRSELIDYAKKLFDKNNT